MNNKYIDGVYINLDIEYIPYQKLIYNPEKYLNKKQKYYFTCKNGIKSKYVVDALKLKGYNAFLTFNDKKNSI